MKLSTKHLYLSLLLLLLAGCGSHGFANLPNQQPSPTQPPPTPTQNGSVVISPQNAALIAGQTQQFTATVLTGSAPVTWLVNDVAGGNATVGTIDANGKYTAPAVSQSINVVVKAALTSALAANYATAPVALVQNSQVSTTANPQVAEYSIYLPQPGKVSVSFGTDTSYGLNTWAQSTPSPYGGMVNILVAGMRASTPYHMQAQVTLDNGVTFHDVDHTFTTGVPPATAPVQATTTSGKIPQPGIELFDTAAPTFAAQAFATDLAGNVIWTYSYPNGQGDFVQPIKLLPNGHMLMVISYLSSIPPLLVSSKAIDVVREVDLAGNTIRELSAATLNQSLQSKGFNITIGSLHHDVLELPNGHLILIATTRKQFDNLPGYPGTTSVLGDVLIDVDQNFNPVWVWNTFDHLDVNRHPFNFPDWTHSNALLYSADDHNLLLSMRHQNWIIKIDYEDGQGSGKILWHLGEDGDFKLIGGTDPTDWFYAQHGPNFFSTNTTGIFKLGMIDNGDDRIFPAGVTCDAAGAPPCHYTTAPVLQIDETKMTATFVSHYAPAGLFSPFGGDLQPLANGDEFADFCAIKTGSLVQELDLSQPTPQVIWQANASGSDQYRAEHLPSLYPGVQW
ncbi:MAG: aryl-sulfate sulfotransferase [Acidobacteriaceae bacterium]